MFLPGVPGELVGERESEDRSVAAAIVEGNYAVRRMKSGHGHFACGLVDLDSHDGATPGDLSEADDVDRLADHAPAQEPFGPSNDQLAHFNPPGSLGHTTGAGGHLQSGHFGRRPVFHPFWAAFL